MHVLDDARHTWGNHAAQQVTQRQGSSALVAEDLGSSLDHV